MNDRRGIALVIVLTVVLALSLIATPFVLSMILQERTAAAYKSARMADYGTEGVRNFAVAWLLAGHDFQERRFPRAPFDDPFVDLPVEYRPSLKDSRLTKELKIADPAGTIWGMDVQDEQGKADLRTAPGHLLDRLHRAIDTRLVDLKDFTTIYANRDSHWILPQRMRSCTSNNGNVAIGILAGCCGKLEPLVVVDRGGHFGSGRIRLAKPGLLTKERILIGAAASMDPSRIGAFASHDPITHEIFNEAYVGGIVELEARHPVNLNTVPRPLLVALLEGLQLFAAPPNAVPVVSRDEAEMLADALLSSPVRTLEELVQRVKACAVGDEEKAMVLLNAVDPSNIQLAGTGTLPFGFASNDVATVEAFSSVNNPSGVQVSGRGFREVVHYTPPVPVDRRWECQYDFDRNLASGAVYQSSYTGFPFGNRVITFPAAPGAESDRARGGKRAWIQLAPSRDLRGTAQYINFREHYDSLREGMELKGGSLPWTWNQVFSPMPDQVQNAIEQMPDVAAGGAEFWIRFQRVTSPIRIIDIREGDFENRISLRYETGQLVFSVSDAAMGTTTDPVDNGLAEIRQPFNPEPETWYHIGAYWKGTRYAHLALLVDGFSHPQSRFTHVDESGNSILTDLPAAIDPVNDTFALSSDVHLPNGSPIQIGQEVILYKFWQDPNDNSWHHVRGARGTVAADHVAGAKVQVFGYSSKVRNVTFAPVNNPALTAFSYDRICIGGGMVQYGFGDDPSATLEGDKTDPNTGRRYIDDSQNYVPVNSNDITEFPQKGYLKIEDEVIYYDDLNTGTQRFTGCQRGQHGTAVAEHNSGVAVELWSIGVDTYGSAGVDDQYLTPTVIQIDDEWFGPVQKDSVRQGFWIGMMNAQDPTKPLRFRRSVFGTIPQAHAAASLVIPTWAARESDNSIGRLNCGDGDPVTLVNNPWAKALMRIRHAWSAIGGAYLANNDPWIQIVGLTANVTAVHRPDDTHVRVVKFPSGELLSLLWCQTSNPSLEIGPVVGTVDEVKFFASPKGNFLLATALPPAGGNSVDMNSPGALSATGGAVKIGDEFLGFSRIASNTLSPATRGWLHSSQQVHDAGDYAFNFSFLPITSLRSSIGATEAEVPVRSLFNYGEGYVLIDQEVVMFNGAGQQPQPRFWMVTSFDESYGLFRGCFGTRPASHSGDDLVYGIPWRYYDTYSPQQFDSRMAWSQVSACIPDAYWRRVTWEEETQGDSNLEVHALVRMDGRGELYDPPRLGFLWDFTDPADKNALQRQGCRNQQGQLDIRFLTEYKDGAYWPANTWKRTPKIFEVRVEYEHATRTLYHEDR